MTRMPHERRLNERLSRLNLEVLEQKVCVLRKGAGHLRFLGGSGLLT